LKYAECPFDAVTREVREEISVDMIVDRLLDSYLIDVKHICSHEASAVDYYDVRDVLKREGCLAFPEQRQALRGITAN
jgi:hypothetical protein